jgi:hypothetical protein
MKGLLPVSGIITVLNTPLVVVLQSTLSAILSILNSKMNSIGLVFIDLFLDNCSITNLYEAKTATIRGHFHSHFCDLCRESPVDFWRASV